MIQSRSTEPAIGSLTSHSARGFEDEKRAVSEDDLRASRLLDPQCFRWRRQLFQALGLGQREAVQSILQLLLIQSGQRLQTRTQQFTLLGRTPKRQRPLFKERNEVKVAARHGEGVAD